MSHAALRSFLSRHQSDAPATADEIEAKRRRAWIEQGVAPIQPDEIAVSDPWLSQAVTNYAEQRWGRRG